jgi:hypothetical protein
MPTNAFYPSLNDFCTKYFVIGPKPLTAEDMRLLPSRAVSECSSLFEHLLLFDRVSLKVYGENVPLAFLYRQLGEKGLEALLEQEAIKFVLWTPMIVHMVDEIPGINALASGNVSLTNFSWTACEKVGIRVGFFDDLRKLDRIENKEKRLAPKP